VSAFGLEGGLRGRLEEALERAGADVFYVTRVGLGEVTQLGNLIFLPECVFFPLSERDTLAALPAVAAVAVEGHGGVYGWEFFSPEPGAPPRLVRRGMSFRAVSSNYFAVRGIPLSGGRTFRSDEEMSGAAVAVCGPQAFNAEPRAGSVYTGTLPPGPTPVPGMTFTFPSDVESRLFTVVGVVPGTGDRFRDETVYVPLGLGPSLAGALGADRLDAGADVDLSRSYKFWVQAEPGRLDEAVAQVKEALASYNTEDGRVDVRLERIGQVVHTRVRQTVAAGLYAVGGLCLLVAAFNASALLLVHVLMDTRGFGVKRCLGAPRATVFAEVAGLAVRTAAAPTVLGVAGGILAAPLVGRFIDEAIAPAPLPCLLAGLATLTAAVLAAFYPASVAASVSPMEAARERTPWARRSEVWRDARRLLAVTAVAIGVAGVVLTMGIGRGVDAKVAAYLESVGEDLLVVEPVSVFETGARSGGPSLALDEDLSVFLRTLPGVRATALAWTIPVGLRPEEGEAPGGGPGGAAAWSCSAVDCSYYDVAGLELACGRWLGPDDRGRAVAVIGSGVAGELFPGLSPADVPGRRVVVGGQAFEVVGVLEPRPKGVLDFRVDRETTVFVPYASRALIPDFAFQASAESILVQAADGATAERLVRDIPDRLGVEYPGLSLPAVRRPIGDLSLLRQTQARFARVFTLLAGVALLMAVAGLANLSLMRATERAREIGVRRALGASRERVVREFLSQAVLVGASGGAVGAVGAAALLAVLASFNGWPVVIAGEGVVVSIALGLLAGVAGGAPPVLSVTRRPPGELLRGRS
jgi:putative ABC transport system permease protein